MFFFPDRLRAFGPRPCLAEPHGRTLCYAELADAVEAFASRLPSQRQLVAIESAPRIEAIVAYLGALAAGHAVLPLPAGDPDTARRLEERFRPGAGFRRFGDEWRSVPLAHRPAAIHPDLMLLLHTSGSTGHGRGVRLSARAVAANAESIASYLEIAPEDRAALVLPLHYSYGLSVLHSHLARGASLWLAPGSVLDAGFAAALAASGATSLAGVPHHFSLLESTGIADALPAGLGVLTVAGGAMAPERVCHWAERMAARGGRFIVMYGQTEATARIAWLPHEQAAEHPDAIGLAIPGGELSLRDAEGAEVTTPVGEGELVYRGPNVMMGYAEDHADLARGHESDTLATGDLARRDGAGLYYLTGRLSRMSKIAGLRIGHDALERALAAEGIEAAVWGDDRAISIAACGTGPELADRAARLAGIGARHFHVFHLPELPRRANGKLDYPALRSRCVRGRPTGDLLSAYRAAFAGRRVGPQDSFAGLGGDSLRHVELSLVLDERLGGAPEGWESMRIDELEGRRPTAAPRLPTDILARALSIVAVVTAHQTLWPVHGGAAAMVILMGMSVASFRWEALVAGNTRAVLAPIAAVLVPYYAILGAYALAWEQVPWVSVFLLGNFALTIPETGLMLPYLYWFIEAYVQMTLLVAALFLAPALRLWFARQGPFATGLCLLVLACLLRVIPELWPLPAGRSQFSLPWVFHLFALGWCIAASNTRGEKLVVLAAACLTMPAAAYLGGNWYGAWTKYMSLLALALVLVLVPRVRLPRVAMRPIIRLAQAAFPIYLLHRLVPQVLLPAVGLDGSGPLVDAVAIAGGIALGLAVASLQRLVMQRWVGVAVRPAPARVAQRGVEAAAR